LVSAATVAGPQRRCHLGRDQHYLAESAVRFLRVHSLRAADALQLAAAFIAAERRPPSLEVITLDERLADAARKEGFALVDLTAG
jgi:predicted nucleic acid-binding protein